MADRIEIEIDGQENVSDVMDVVSRAADDAGDRIVDAMGNAGDSMQDAAAESGKFGAGLDKVGGAAAGMNNSISTAADVVSALTDYQQAAKEKAAALARAQNDVDQAQADVAQSALDAKQATLDLNQAQQDGAQAAADEEQAEIDVKQALADGQAAQDAYNEAVKAHGANSKEAQQASIDLAQAQHDLKQANLDVKQAQADASQAQADQNQATQDYKQAAIDGKSAALDLADAQKEATSPKGMTAWVDKAIGIAPIIMGVAGAVDLLTMANNALSLSFIKATATQVATKVATAATTVATGIATAAQWLWNIALDANPIGIIILAIMALIAIIVLIATKTTWFQTLWHAIWGAIGDPIKTFIGWIVAAWNVTIHALAAAVSWVKDAIVTGFRFAVDFVVGYFKFIFSIPGKVLSVFASIGNAIAAPFKAGFNMISHAWNSTVGRLSFTMPSWIPGIGGMGFSMPKLPTLAKGGDIVSTGLVLAHAGERVLTAAQTKAQDRGSRGGMPPIFIGSGAGATIAELLNQLVRHGDLNWFAGDDPVVVG